MPILHEFEVKDSDTVVSFDDVCVTVYTTDHRVAQTIHSMVRDLQKIKISHELKTDTDATRLVISFHADSSKKEIK